MKKSAWIIFFSFLMIAGCSTTKDIVIDNQKWPLPNRVEFKHVELLSASEVDNPKNGYYLSGQDAMNLADNIEGLKAYSEKLELLIYKIQEFYNTKEESEPVEK